MITLHPKGLLWFARLLGVVLTIFIVVFSNFHFAQATQNDNSSTQPLYQSNVSGTNPVFIPITYRIPRFVPTVNIPYFNGTEVNYHQAAVTWFGQVRGNENYADVRVGYNSEEIYVRVSVFDRFLWYDTTPDLSNLTEWDSVTLYLDLEGNNGAKLSPSMYSFTRQIQWWNDGLNRQAAYQGDPSGWSPVPLIFYTNSGWKGNAPNDMNEDRGYAVTFHIPFSSLGMASAPAEGTKWGAAITLHDRDDANGTTRSEKYWVQDFKPASSATWGVFSFGLPEYDPPQGTNPQVFTFRNGLNGAHVKDGEVGGSTVCGQGMDFWFEWGDHAYPGIRYMNAQNQGNVDDWPCFSKFYLTFPLNSLPGGKVVNSATMTLHQIGQSTGFPNDPPQALTSLIRVSTIGQNWDENTITWNNAPLPVENVSQSWVGFMTEEELGKPYTWDLSRAVSSAYEAGEPLRIVLYSADTYGPNGKYFFSSDESWDIMRPSLTVELGDQ